MFVPRWHVPEPRCTLSFEFQDACAWVSKRLLVVQAWRQVPSLVESIRMDSNSWQCSALCAPCAFSRSHIVHSSRSTTVDGCCTLLGNCAYKARESRCMLYSTTYRCVHGWWICLCLNQIKVVCLSVCAEHMETHGVGGISSMT